MLSRQRLRDNSEPFATGLYFPKLKRRRSKLHGWGVYAGEDINKNKRVIHYAGEKIGAEIAFFVKTNIFGVERFGVSELTACSRVTRMLAATFLGLSTTHVVRTVIAML